MPAANLVVGSLEDLSRALEGDGAVVEVIVSVAVPGWLEAAVSAAHEGGRRLVVRAERVDPAAAPEALAGWEIGVATAALTAGVDEVVGIDPKRLARVRAVVERLAR